MKKKWMKIFLFCFLQSAFLIAHSLQEGYMAYQNGERAETIVQREAYFNLALKHYSGYEPKDGYLFYNMGNCYYQLNQYGMAVWCYLKAHKEISYEKRVLDNLFKTYQALNLSPPTALKVKNSFFAFYPKINLNLQSTLFIVFAIAAFLSASAMLWFKNRLSKMLTPLFVMIALSFGATIWSPQYATKQAVLVEPTLVRCGAGLQYKEIDSQIEKVGQKVKIIGLSEDSNWAKVKTLNHKTGFVLTSHLRFL